MYGNQPGRISRVKQTANTHQRSEEVVRGIGAVAGERLKVRPQRCAVRMNPAQKSVMQGLDFTCLCSM